MWSGSDCIGIRARSRRATRVDLDQHPVVHIRAEVGVHCAGVRRVPVAGELHPICEPRLQISDKLPASPVVSPTHQPEDHELGIRIHGGPGVHVAVAPRARLHGPHLGPDKRPDLVALDSLGPDAHTTLTQAHPRHYPATPAMAAGLADHAWTVEELCGLLASERPAS